MKTTNYPGARTTTTVSYEFLTLWTESHLELDSQLSSLTITESSEEEVDDKIDALKWWKLQEMGPYPNLAQMARDYLSIPASSAATERSFSVAENLITENRNCLSPETVRALMCLKSWRKSGLISE